MIGTWIKMLNYDKYPPLTQMVLDGQEDLRANNSTDFAQRS